MEIEERILRYLSKCPGAISGSGGHNQCFFVTMQLYWGFGLDESQTLAHLLQYNIKCQPQWSERELKHKVASAAKQPQTQPRGYLIGGNGAAFTPNQTQSKPTPRVEVKQDPMVAITRFLSGFTCTESDLFDASPVKPSEDFAQDGCLVLQHLFQPGELVNYVTEFSTYERKSDGVKKANPQGYGETVERDALIAQWQLLGMPSSEAGGWMRFNPLDGLGVDDKNVTAFRMALLEFDSIPLDTQLCVLVKLPLPIAVILTSGGKSVHAWVMVEATDRTDYDRTVEMIRDWVSVFGVDKQNKNPSRLSRLVGVQRVIGAEGDGRQRLLYLNPKPKQEAIL